MSRDQNAGQNHNIKIDNKSFERLENTGFWRGNLMERKHLEDPGIDGRIILKWIFKKWDVRCTIDTEL
jgi:hypothetical protein